MLKKDGDKKVVSFSLKKTTIEKINELAAAENRRASQQLDHMVEVYYKNFNK